MSENNGASPGLTQKEILDLGQHLITLEDINSQKQYLVDLVQKLFQSRAFIWLGKHQIRGVKLPDEFHIPFDLDSLINDFDNKKDKYLLFEHNHQFWLIIPLSYYSQTFGLLICYRKSPFTDNLIDSLLKVGLISSLVLYASEQTSLQIWYQKQLSLVQSVAAKISQINDLNSLALQITKLVQETFGYYYVAIFLVNENFQKLFFKASSGADQSEHPEFESPSHPGFALGEHIIGHVAKTGQEVVANDVDKEPRYKSVNALQETRSEVTIPLQIETRTLGVFDIQSDQINAFDENDLIILRVLADNIALAIESTRLYHKEQNRGNQLELIEEVSRAITSILDTDEQLKKIAALIQERFEFPYVHVFLVDPAQKKIVFKAGSGKRASLYAIEKVSFDLDSNMGILPWVVRHAQTKRVNDINKEPLFLKTSFSLKTPGSEMAIPLCFGNEVLGVLDIQSYQINAFTIEDQRLMETLGDNLAIAIRNARLYQTEKWRRQVAESLRDVAGLLSENIDLGESLQAILSQLHKNLPCDLSGIWLIDQSPADNSPVEEKEYHLETYQTSDEFSAHDLGQINLTPENWIRKAISQQKTTIRKPGDSIDQIAKFLDLNSDYSGIAAPLHAGDEVLGIMTMIHHDHGKYGAESEKIISAFASYAAIAIKNARLYAESQEQAWISTILLQVTQAIQTITDLSDLASTIVRLTPLVTGVKGCGLILREVDQDNFYLYSLYGIGKPAESLPMDMPVPVIGAEIFSAFSDPQEIFPIKNPDRDLNLPDSLSQLIKDESLLLLPLFSRNELIGAFLLAEERQNGISEYELTKTSSERLRIVQGIMQQTATAVENIRLLEARQEDAYVSTVLLQTAEAVVGSGSIEDTLESLVQIMPILVGIDNSVIYLWDDEKAVFTSAHASTSGSTDDNAILGMSYPRGEFPMLDAVLHNNHPIVYPFTETSLPPEDWDLVLPDEDQSDPVPVLQSHFPLLMGFPLSVKDEIFGVLLAQDQNYSTNRERRFDLLWGIAQQASLAIQNDLLNKEMIDRHRLEQEFKLARDIQQTFLPEQLPEVKGWGIDVRWETARQVGGDFYDCFLLPDGQLAFLIADVSDKGLAASLYMAVTRTLIRAAAIDTYHPADVLEQVNDLLLMNSQGGLFVTIFYGILNLDSGNLEYTIAGHNPPVLLRKQTNQVILFPIGGIAIGAMPDIQLPQREVMIEPGDCLVLYTDGVTEAMASDDQMYGDQRLNDVLSQVIGKNSRSVLEHLENDINTFRGDTPLSDDTTMLAICRSSSLADENRYIRST